MFKPGDVVYHDFLVFSDGGIETTKNKIRPCIVLNRVEYNGVAFVVTVPCTTQLKTFNKHPDQYFIVPERMFGKQYSFIRYQNVGIHLESQTYPMNCIVSEQTVSFIIEKILKYNGNIHSETYQLLLKQKQEMEEAKRLEKHKRKMLRKMKKKSQLSRNDHSS